MSNFNQWTKHPETGLWENAYWIDDYYEKYHYGVEFPSDGVIYDPGKVVLWTTINLQEAKILNEHKRSES